MILPQLIRLHLDYEKNAHEFFELQARDAILWLNHGDTIIGPNTRVLDLGCGHGEFSPWHYLGMRQGPIHTVGKNLFKTYIGEVLRTIRKQEGLAIRRMAPRYYNELAFLMHLPIAREFLAWNSALEIQRSSEAQRSS